MIKVIKITNNEIHLFAEDSKFADWENIPISKYRAISFSNNPRSSPQDIVLYLAYIEDKLVGYRTVLPDLVFVGDTQIKVGWLSGNWVHPNYRRKGIATLLFDEAYKDWGNYLLFTNYAIESKAVYDKSEKFELLSARKGKRFYLRSCFSTLLPPRSLILKKNITILKGFDFILNLINPVPSILRMVKFGSSIELEYLSHPDSDVLELFEKECKSTISRRSREELQWIFDYPWLVSSPLGDKMGERYFFSSNPKRFIQSIIKVFNGKDLLGFLMINVNDDKLSVPYCAFNSNDSELMAKVLLLYAVKFKASTITVYEPNLVNAIKQRWLFRLFSKNRNQSYFATKKLANEFKGNPVAFRGGDGDCAFI